MMRTVMPAGLRFAAAALLFALSDTPPLAPPEEDPIEADVRALAGPDGRVGYFGCINPGGPIFDHSPPMDRLAARGAAARPRLVAALADPRRRNEAAIVLAEVGDRDVISHLIDLLPPVAELTEEESFSRLCVLYALWQLTGKNVGIDIKFVPRRPPDARAEWRAWYAENRDYLYTPADGADARGRRVRVDLEAKLAGTPTDAFRRRRPWVRADEVRTWQDDPASDHALREFCYQELLDTVDLTRRADA